MYCIYCGKKCPDIAKFCPSCGKEQLKTEDGEKSLEIKQPTIEENIGDKSITDSRTFRYNSNNQLSASNTLSSSNINIKPIACAASIISLIVEAIIIFLTFTDIFKINLGNGYYSSSIEIGIFDLFDMGNNIPRITQNMDNVASGLVWYAVLCLICVAICVIYFLYNLFSYSFSDDRRCVWGKNYAHYSSVPAIVFIGASLVGILIFASMADEYIRVVPNSSLIGIYILTGIQFVTNIIYDSNY